MTAREIWNREACRENLSVSGCAEEALLILCSGVSMWEKLFAIPQKLEGREMTHATACEKATSLAGLLWRPCSCICP